LPFTTKNNAQNNAHLMSLSKYGDNYVKTPIQTSETAWTKIFGECLSDVKDIPDYEFVKKYRDEFKKVCEKTNDVLNTMTKREFVELFAKTMNDIFNEEEENKRQKGGDSKNKSRKRSTRKHRLGRRHRRRTTTRKYKKLYK
jgi:hypothetical protein